MNKNSAQNIITDSISCLHAIEHFGLGRYGDPFDPTGHIKGFNNFIHMLKPDGNLNISFPIGKQNEVHCHAHRVFRQEDIFTWAENIRFNQFNYFLMLNKLHGMHNSK